MHKKLFIPGPVEVRSEVLAKMATPMIGHRSADASFLQKRISDNLKKVFYTQSEILLSTTSGSGLMEGAIRCCTLKKAAVFSVGAFGKRWYEMAKENGKEADLFEVPMGEAITPEMVEKALETGKYDLVAVTHNETSTGVMNPVKEIGRVIKKYDDIVYIVDAVSSAVGTRIEVDAWGIDVLITSTQKAIGLPPGMAICTFSNKAKERAEKVPNRGFYLDLLALYKYIKKKDYQYPSTPSLSHMFALDYQLDYIVNKEGLDNRFARHKELAKITRAWAKKHFELFADERYLSNTVTAIKNTRAIEVTALNKELSNRGYAISNGYGSLKDKTFRIGHMADCTVEELNDLLKNINEILKLED
ncbi:MAG: pyridoxal-phosphate-dependent aminotransferase family protein [Clostridium sp.]|uniref:pyridoxal-phosphate-dependent aminotransferase family protein n=1 Tax=Clostridium sp. TaxID=1506 RepID=UPI003F4164FB